MKLELKHLAPYLPYGLKMVHFDSQFKNGFEVHTLDGLSENYRYKKDDLDDDDDLELLNIKEITFWFNRSGLNSTVHDVKPILRPLLDLTKYHLKEIHRKCPNLPNWHDFHKEWINENEDLSETIIEYAVMEILLSWHFDVFGLIPKGLAIDINTLNN